MSYSWTRSEYLDGAKMLRIEYDSSRMRRIGHSRMKPKAVWQIMYVIYSTLMYCTLVDLVEISSDACCRSLCHS